MWQECWLLTVVFACYCLGKTVSHTSGDSGIPKLPPTPGNNLASPSWPLGTPSQNPGWMMSQMNDLTAAKELGSSVAWRRGRMFPHPPNPPCLW